MKKLFKYILIGVTGFSVLSCSKFEEVNTNPEATEKATSAMIATRIILNLANQSTQKSFMMPYLLNKNVIWTEFVESYQYNGFGTSSVSMTAINDAENMVKFAASEKLAKSYEGLKYFARAVKFYESTMDLGDIPYSEALKGETEKNYFPKYDTQKEVFVGILNELELADKAFSEGEKFSGDPIYAGDINKWRKLVNSFSLNVLMQLSKKDSDPDLNVKGRFQTILTSKPIFASNADNYEIKRSDKNGQQYPFYKVGNNFTIYPTMSTEIVDRLKDKQDRRLFYYGNPAAKKLSEGKTQSDFAAYVGIDHSQSFDVITTIKNSGDYSKLNDRYMEIPTGEPTQQLSYAQVCFIIAEAAARGWISDDAVDWYKKGVEASMKFIYANTPNTTQFHHNMPLDDTYINTYVAGIGTSFPTNLEARIEEILVQKYLASFLQSEFATYYDYRRTGYPKWKINPATSLNSEAPTKIPVRWKYPTVEFDYNTENVDAAVQRQFNGVDDINQLMWILK